MYTTGHCRRVRDGRSARAWRLRRIVLAAAVVALSTQALGCGDTGSTASNAAATTAEPVPPLRHEGRWLVDTTGRVVILHGLNFVEKGPPFYPAAAGFGADDAAFLAKHGFNLFRLGVVFEATMSEPGVIDHQYIDDLGTSVRDLSAEHIFVLLDFHQDGYGPAVHGNGMPAWATLTDGLPNPEAAFPLYYIQNPALQRAFENFWANRAGPDGVGLQDNYVAAARALARRFAEEPYLLGYEAMNEPWPGHDWMPCLTGCPDLEAMRLVPFYERFATSVREVDSQHFAFVEPFVLFNFGRTDTALPAIGSPLNGLSVHVYALSPPDNLVAIGHAVAAAERIGDALLATEWGATTDPAVLRRTAGQFDSRLVSWIFWAYDEDIIVNPGLPPAADNVRQDAIDAITRPFPVATNGTPLTLAFDPETRILDYTFSTRLPDGRQSRADAPTAIVVPPSTYPEGYRVSVTGAVATSAPGALYLQLRNLQDAETVSVQVTSGP